MRFLLFVTVHAFKRNEREEEKEKYDGKRNGDKRRELEKLWEEMGVQAEIEELKEINRRRKGKKKMVLVRMGTREEEENDAEEANAERKKGKDRG